MRNFSKYIILFAFPLVLGTGILFLFPVDKNFSYHFVKGECDDKANWIYNRIFENDNPIDIAFSGASQTACAIMDEVIETEINTDTNNHLNVANLGYCRRGRDIQYVMLKDLFKHKKPKLLIIEVAEDEPKKSHPVFPYLADSGDLFGSFIFFNQRYFAAIWKGLILRFEHLKFSLFKSKDLLPQRLGRYGYLPSSQVVRSSIIQQNRSNWQKRLSNPKPAFIRKIELNYSKYYLEEIVSLAKRNHCEVVFLFLPESGSDLNSPLLTDYYNEMGNLLILPDSMVKNKLNWKDATHFNDAGALKVSEYVASFLTKLKPSIKE
jgi:hypothetical protein